MTATFSHWPLISWQEDYGNLSMILIMCLRPIVLSQYWCCQRFAKCSERALIQQHDTLFLGRSAGLRLLTTACICLWYWQDLLTY